MTGTPLGRKRAKLHPQQTSCEGRPPVHSPDATPDGDNPMTLSPAAFHRRPVGPAEVQKFLRPSDPRLALAIYTHFTSNEPPNPSTPTVDLEG
jgi:hypothetical protein